MDAVKQSRKRNLSLIDAFECAETAHLGKNSATAGSNPENELPVGLCSASELRNIKLKREEAKEQHERDELERQAAAEEATLQATKALQKEKEKKKRKTQILQAALLSFEDRD
jgi:hypothetical protein